MHQRYGDLREIWRRTDGNCHRCHGAVDLYTYGFIGVYGGRTATIDCHPPAARGVEVRAEHLRMAHLSCNSRRDAPRAEPARREFVSGEIGERRGPIARRPVDERGERRSSLNRALVVTIACAVAALVAAVMA